MASQSSRFFNGQQFKKNKHSHNADAYDGYAKKISKIQIVGALLLI